MIWSWCTRSTTFAVSLFRYSLLLLVCLGLIGSDTAFAQTSSTPALTINPTSLSFSAAFLGADPAIKYITVSNTGGGTFRWSSTDNSGWMTSDATGTNSGTIPVRVYTKGNLAGTYSGTVTITAVGYPSLTKTVPVTVTITSSGGSTSPTIGLSTTSLAFSGTVGGANPAGKAFSISNAGGGTLSWTVSDNTGWLSVSPTSGTNTGAVTAFANLSGLAAGTYSGSITISATGATNSPRTIPVSFTVSSTTSTTKSATLTWTANGETDLAGYKIYRATSTGAYGAPIATLGKVTSYAVANLQTNTTYFFVITAYDSSGNESSYSNEVSKSVF